jgi:glycosyltransferase involved in cell wall biosynthesis
MSLPLSICIPTRNRAPLLRRTLEHLLECRHAFSEIVVSDNASDDGTGDVAAAWQPCFEKFRYVRQPTNIGVFRNIYAAMSQATSDFTFVLSDDDALIPEALDQAVATLSADPECVAVFGGYERCDAELKTTQSITLPPYPGRYTGADKLALARNANMLTHGVLRRAVAQRHCFLDDTTFGFMRMIGQLLDHGTVRIVAQPLYRHAETAGRLESQLAEAHYQDGLRADWEAYAAAIAGADGNTSIGLVTNMILAPYLLAHRAAAAQDLPLLERTFLVRYLAYTGHDAHAVEVREAWERTRLIAAATTLLVARIAGAGARRLIVERGPMNIAAIFDAIREKIPNLAIVEIDSDGLDQFKDVADDFVVAECWETLERGEAAGRFLGRQLAVADLIASLRLPGSLRQPLLLGPTRSVHMIRG